MGMPPVGDASSSFQAEPPMDDMGNDAVPQDNEMPEPPMDNMGDNEEASGKVKEIMDTANQISEKDQDTLLAYARSLKDASEEAGVNNDEMSSEPPMGAPMGGGETPMQESVVFTKKQLRTINENFGEMNGELDRDKKLGHTTKMKSDKNKEVSPFDPPRKNRK